jgi:hypothetical protein
MQLLDDSKQNSFQKKKDINIYLFRYIKIISFILIND